MYNYVLTVTCPSRRGIVAAISGFLAANGCNITDSAQFDDSDTDRFFMRVSFRSETGTTLPGLRDGFRSLADKFAMEFAFHDSARKQKLLLMVSNFGHCLNDLLYRWRIGALPVEIVGVVSNHETYRTLVDSHGIPFHQVRVTPQNKVAAEARLLEIVETSQAEIVVLARYMQILSDAVCQRMEGRIINIHHSFLPSFKDSTSPRLIPAAARRPACVPMPDRFTVAGALPRVVLPGALNFLGLGEIDTLCPDHRARAHYRHTGHFTHVKLTEAEMVGQAKALASALNAATGPTHVLIPMGGLSHEDRTGGAIEDSSLRLVAAEGLETEARAYTVERLPHHINAPETADAAVAALLQRMPDA